MSSPSPSATMVAVDELTPEESKLFQLLKRWMVPIEVMCAALMVGIVFLLFGGVIARYVFSQPVGWIDEAVSFAFIWVAMLGSVLAMHRNEHLRLTMFVDMLRPQIRTYVHAFALVAVAVFLMGLIYPAIEHVESEWIMRTPALDIPSGIRVTAIAVGLILMLTVVAVYAAKTVPVHALTTAILGVGAWPLATRSSRTRSIGRLGP